MKREKTDLQVTSMEGLVGLGSLTLHTLKMFVLHLNVLQDVQYADIDYMDRQLNFVLDPEFSKLPALVERIQDEGGRFIIILVTSITADREKHYQTCH